LRYRAGVDRNAGRRLACAGGSAIEPAAVVSEAAGEAPALAVSIADGLAEPAEFDDDFPLQAARTTVIPTTTAAMARGRISISFVRGLRVA